MLGLGTLVMVADPELIKQTFQADPRTLHAGTDSPLRRILGPNSMLGIDEEQHMEQRRLLLPPFKGQRMRTYEPLIAEIAAAEIDTWPTGVEFASNESMQRITLRAILRALFGAEGSRLAQLERFVPPWTTLGSRLATTTFLQRDLGRRSPWRRFLELRRSIDAILDELVTMIAAGHETTAHTLSWAIDRLRRHPELLRRLVEEADAGGKALREASIREVQRVRPVIPFGGGRRRCIGASFAHMELDVVLRTILQRVELQPTTEPGEKWKFRGVAWGPADGGQTRVTRRAVTQRHTTAA